MFFGNIFSTLFTGLVILAATNGFTWFYATQYGKEQCMDQVAAAAYQRIVNRQQLLVRLNERAARRANRNLTEKERREERFLAALDVIAAYPGLKKCMVPREVREALDRINYPQRDITGLTDINPDTDTGD